MAKAKHTDEAQGGADEGQDKDVQAIDPELY